jgi:acetyl esterase/lipase
LRGVEAGVSQVTRVVVETADSSAQRLLAGVLRAATRFMARRTFRAGLPIEVHRRRVHQATRLTFAPRGTVFAPATCGDVRGEWVRARDHARAPLVILYLHGGGYVSGSPASHRAVTGHLAARCDARVFAADYRLAPEHPFPSALDDALAAYRGLLAEGVNPGSVVIAGDSAGGGLSVATVLRLRELALPLPRALVLFSPWTDLGLQHLRLQADEVLLTLPWLREGAQAYLGSRDAGHPLVSPVLAQLQGLPPTLIQVGTDEVLLEDSRRLHERLTAAGVATRLEEYPGRWHVFHLFAGILADADRALDAVARFIRAAGPTPAG